MNRIAKRQVPLHVLEHADNAPQAELAALEVTRVDDAFNAV
jgi:hypothetical protein